MKKLKLLALGLSVFLLQSCVSVPLAQNGSNEAKEALSFESIPNKAVVYLYRAEKSNYGLYAINVTFNGKSVNTLSNGFLRVDLDPKEYTVVIDLPELTSDEQEFHLNAQSGSITFLEMNLRNRFMLGGVTSLRKISKEEAVKELKRRSLVAQLPIHL